MKSGDIPSETAVLLFVSYVPGIIMSRPVPRINTFFEKTSKPTVESISKIFIVAGIIVGINRLPIIASTKTFWIALLLCYTIILNVLFIYFTQYSLPAPYMACSIYFITDCVQFSICTTFGFMLHKRLLNFYANLNKFDADIGINTTKFGIRESVYNLLQLLVTIVQCVTLYFLCKSLMDYYQYSPHVIHIKILNCFELHYCGHLFSLLIPRLKVVNSRMQLFYPNKKNGTKLNDQRDQRIRSEDKKSHLNMKLLMDFYNKMITVHDCLNEAVKWQMLTLLISTFTLSLCLLYQIIKSIIWEDVEKQEVLLVCILGMSIQFLPVLVPCVFADRVQKEVRLIKDFLACKLYENTLDKPTRSTARTLLSLIETQNLSFSLFHMFDIDIALPFKFMALLLTYLIILLQFDKVISPNTTASTPLE